MKSGCKLLRRAGKEAVYSVGTFRDLASFLRAPSPGTQTGITQVFRPRVAKQAHIEALAASAPADRFCQIGYSRMTRANGRRARPAGEATGRKPSSRAELRYTLTGSFIRHFAESWEDYLGTELTAAFLDILLSRCTIAGTTLVHLRGRFVGMASLFPERDCLGRPLDQVAWVWMERSLGPQARAMAHGVIAQALSKANSRRLQAGVHLKNLRSQRFFTKLGFIPTCIHCAPRRA